ncbi:hypothetical protein, partial [Desulfosarcina sp. BuS5]|uniref:hypothetical protein n=1 Tax=Desulfosarcina sp. BuS5 TaxID=933262 RepID=UPI001E3C65E1
VYKWSKLTYITYILKGGPNPEQANYGDLDTPALIPSSMLGLNALAISLSRENRSLIDSGRTRITSFARSL